MMKAGVLLNKLNQTLGLETFMTAKIEQHQGQTKTWGNGPDCKGLMDGADFTKLTSFVYPTGSWDGCSCRGSVRGQTLGN